MICNTIIDETCFTAATAAQNHVFKSFHNFSFFSLACVRLPALSSGDSGWETVHLRQWRIWSPGSKVNVQQDAA